MEQLPAALAPLAAYRQFIVWRLVPTEGGKPKKVPVNPVTLAPINPHDPLAWLDVDTAITRARLAGPDCAVGFVLTDNDPFWFIDIDKPSDDAAEIIQLLAGAATELSQSGAGMHIIGTGLCPPHASRSPLGIELYTEARFIALTGVMAQGDAQADLSAKLPYLVSRWFPAPMGGTSAEWTTAPCPAWNGLTDDETLLAKALGSGGAKAAFGGSCPFEALWEAQGEILGQFYPDPAREYDASSADAALAQRLAFWTGKDCERIERLMRQSGLARDKWDRRERPPGYLRTTILKSVSQQADVYNANGGGSQAPSPPIPGDGISPDDPSPGFRYLAPTDQQLHFAGCVYVSDLHRIWTPQGQLLRPEQFRAVYGGWVFALDTINEKTTRNAWEAFVETQALDNPKVVTSCFRPELPSGAIVMEEGQTMLNTYVPIETERREGDPGRFVELIEKLLPDERDRNILLAYMAAVVQHPGVKFQWCPLIQGAEGNGKTLLIRALSHAVGHRYTHLPKAQELAGKFNHWIRNRLFVGVEEIYVTERREVTEMLKILITNERIEIEGKGVDQTTGDNRANFVMCTNHKDALRVSFDTRRYAVMYTAQQCEADLVRDGMSGTYFPALYNWLRDEGGYAIVNDYLRRYQIPDELNPATKCQRAPMTSSTSEAVSLSVGAVEQEVMDAIEEERTGFGGGWVSSICLDRLLDDIRAGGKIPRNRRRAIMQSLGYDWHPALADGGGRVNNVVAQEGGKPKLYIKRGHISANIDNAADVIRAYLKAQGYVDTRVNEA